MFCSVDIIMSYFLRFDTNGQSGWKNISETEKANDIVLLETTDRMRLQVSNSLITYQLLAHSYFLA